MHLLEWESLGTSFLGDHWGREGSSLPPAPSPQLLAPGPSFPAPKPSSKPPAPSSQTLAPSPSLSAPPPQAPQQHLTLHRQNRSLVTFGGTVLELKAEFLGLEGIKETLRGVGFPGGSAGKESAWYCGRCGFNSWVGKIPWRRERLPTPVRWPGEFHALYSCKGLDTTEQLSLTRRGVLVEKRSFAE